MTEKDHQEITMEYLRIENDFPRLSNSAVTLGKFDGIHRGHQRLVGKILEQKEDGAQAVIFAFDAASKQLFVKEERAAYLESLGVDILLECPLNDKIKHMKAESFVKEILVGDLSVSYVVVGEDFRFGYERKGTPEMLREFGKKFGFEVEVLPKEMEGRRKVSSTYIREELKYGNMEKVSRLLGRNFTVSGVIEHGQGMGRKKLFPTTNIVPAADKLMPPNGVYLTISHFGEKSYYGVTNVGYKPTVGEVFLGVETYLFGCDEDLYGQNCVVEFLKFQRPEQKFSSVEVLKKQIQKDIEEAENYFLETAKK